MSRAAPPASPIRRPIASPRASWALETSSTAPSGASAGALKPDGGGARPRQSPPDASSPTRCSSQAPSRRTNWRTPKQSRNSLPITITGASRGTWSRLSAKDTGTPANRAAWALRRGALSSTSHRSMAARKAGSAFAARRRSPISAPEPGPSSTSRTGAGRPMAAHTDTAQTPIISPNICETSGAVMKSPAAPSPGRVA